MNRRSPLAVAIVFAGSQPVSPTVLDRLPDRGDVIAADSGLGVAMALGVHVDHLVGDLDSAAPHAVDAAVASGTTVERHPAEKDATDLELAFDAAVTRGARHVVLVDGGGDRLDHLLANLLLLASTTFATAQMEAYCGTARIAVARGGDPPLHIDGRPDSFVSLLPIGGPASGIVTHGLRYPLHDEELAPGSTRGVSNELVAAQGSVQLTSGTLLVVQPFSGAEAAGPHETGAR
jgi:thiamine pyrophosphokinase